MKRIHPEDPRITAYAFGELPEHERAQVRHAADSNPAVEASLQQTIALAELIRAGYKSESHELGEARREAIRRAGRRPQPDNLVTLQTNRKWLRPAALAAGAAALVASAVWIMQQIPVGEGALASGNEAATQRESARADILLRAVPGPPGTAGRQIPGAPASSLFPGGGEIPAEVVEEEFKSLRELRDTDPAAFLEHVKQAAESVDLPTLAKLPLLDDNPFVPTREEARSDVPIISGSASYHVVERFVRTEKKLPPRNGIRIEELINRVAYQDAGDADLDGVRLGAELVHCPWDPGAILMGVLLYNGSAQPITSNAILRVELNPDHIRSYRLIGYAGASGSRRADKAVQRGLAPGKSNFVLYQLQPLEHEVFQNYRVLARVGLSLDRDHPRGLIVPVTSPPRDWMNASNNLRTAVALAGWGMLLRDSPYAGKLNAGMVQSLALDAQAEAEEGDLVRREALQLVLDSLPLLSKAN